MKKNLTILILLLAVSIRSICQEIDYKYALNEAFKIAAQTKKPVAILINTPQINAIRSLTDLKVINKLNADFINVKMSKDDSIAKTVMKQHFITSFPSLVFVDAQNNLLTKGLAIGSQSVTDLMDKALKLSSELTLKSYYEQFRIGEYDSTFLKKIILRRQEAGLFDNAIYVEKYVDFLTLEQLNNYDRTLFVLKAGPLVGGKAFKLININQNNIDSIIKNEKPSVVTKFQDRIINNSTYYAIRSKSTKKALELSKYIKSTYGKDSLAGEKYANLKMLQYYLAVKDTSNYLNLAYNFFEPYLKITKDSVEKHKASKMTEAKKIAMENASRNAKSITTISFSVKIDNYDTELNNAAYAVYRFGIKSEKYLEKALQWSKHAINLSPKAAYYDTLSHILYRLQLFKEAENTQEKAIELAKLEKMSYKNYEAELEKIKARSL